jgi:hypothetical protein
MNSREWDAMGFTKFTNPSGEVIRKKTYHRTLLAWDNQSTRSLVSERKRLAELLEVPAHDLLANLSITIEIDRYPQHRRFLKYIPRGRIAMARSKAQ